MTAAQRATLERMEETLSSELSYVLGEVRDEDQMFWIAQERDALRAALGTCGTCAHAADRESVADRYTFCSAPNDPSRFPFLHKQMPMGERCNGWEPWKDDDA
jgi:hypothetical protein